MHAYIYKYTHTHRHAYMHTAIHTQDARSFPQRTKLRVQMCVGTKDGTNLEFHTNRILNRISSKFRIQIEYRIEYEYIVASNSNRILNGVESLAGTLRHPVAMSSSPCQSRRHRGHTHRYFCLLSDLTIKTISYSRQSYHHISCAHTHTVTKFNNFTHSCKE